MKIGILTHYNVINNGATLQMYALQSFLEHQGHEVFILTYQKNYDYSEDAAKKYNRNIKGLLYIFKSYFVKGSPALFFHKVHKQFMFSRFIKRNFRFLDYQEELDAIIIGSDEVFSLEAGCNKMMYGHELHANRIIAYAPSFGQTGISLIKQRGCEDIIASGLAKFHRLSVRDEYSRKTIQELCNITCPMVCDPVILYDFSSTHVKIKAPKKKYLLLYSYDKNMNDEETVAAIQEYAKRRDLLIISAGTYHKWCDQSVTCNPLVWIEYFRNAEEVITDTFHGAVLSIILQKKGLFLRQSINGNKLTSLIHEFGLDDYLTDQITNDRLLEFEKQVYDKDSIHQLVLKKRSVGALYLEEALS